MTSFAAGPEIGMAVKFKKNFTASDRESLRRYSTKGMVFTVSEVVNMDGRPFVRISDEWELNGVWDWSFLEPA